jgi:dihydroneopterin aldolase
MHERPLVTVGGLIVASDGDVLLVRSEKWKSLYSIPGGKVEQGETREEALAREVWEETGLKIKNIRFAMVQDSIFSSEFWQERHFVMNDFIADLDSSSDKADVILNSEAYEYCWIGPDKALLLPLHSACRHLIEWYLKHKTLEAPKWGTIGFVHHCVSCIVGINPEEREKEQDLFIDLKVKVDFSRCLRSGHIKDTVNYVQLADFCTTLIRQNRYQLLETLAWDVLKQLIDHFSLSWASIKVKKPAALPSSDYAIVEMESAAIGELK